MKAIPGGKAIQIPAEDGGELITVLVTVGGNNKLAALERFLSNFEVEILLKHQKVQLCVVLFKDVAHKPSKTAASSNPETSLHRLVKEKAVHFKKNYPGNNLRILEKEGAFSRSIGLTEGLHACKDMDLVFIVDVDIYFTVEVLDSVRRFTSYHQAAYFPIFFKEFSNGNGGFWHVYSCGVVAAFKADIMRAGGFDTSIHGWGKEDVDLYNKVCKTGITITRTTDPHLVHVYHKASCW